jgi:branched-chain amino acid transport system substrate-binding protein
LSGPDEIIGKHGQQGIQIALEEVNQDDKRGAAPLVKVRHADSHGEGDNELAQASRLMTINRVTALITATEAAGTERLAQSAELYEVPVLSCTGLPAKPVSSLLFTLALTPDRQAFVLSRFLLNEHKSKRIVIVADSKNALGTAVADAVLRECGKAKDSPERIEKWAFDRDRLADQAGRIQEFKADAVVFAAAASELPAFRAQLKKVSAEPVVVYGGAEAELHVLQADRDASQGVYLATSYVCLPDEGPAEGQAFAKKYQERFGQKPDLYAALAYDATRILSEVLRKSGPANQSGLRKELAELDNFASVTGPLSFKGGQARRTAFLARLEDGQLKVARSYKPDEE